MSHTHLVLYAASICLSGPLVVLNYFIAQRKSSRKCPTTRPSAWIVEIGRLSRLKWWHAPARAVGVLQAGDSSSLLATTWTRPSSLIADSASFPSVGSSGKQPGLEMESSDTVRPSQPVRCPSPQSQEEGSASYTSKKHRQHKCCYKALALLYL